MKGGGTGDVACDQYHRYPEDVALMADLGVRAYRFSIAWPRIQPEGRGPAEERGLDHYRRLVQALRDRDIEPVATLYHWDLPQALEDAGGWGARETAERFAEYAAIVHRALDAVDEWITINEPWVAAWLGYSAGVHAPGRTDDAVALAASHHLLLAHGLARQAMGGGGRIGISLNLEPHRPASDDPRDAAATELVDQQLNRLFLDPLFGRGYPSRLMDHYRSVTDLSFVRADDLATIAGPPDFLGVNYYRPQTIAADPRRPGRAYEAPGSLGAWTVVPPDAEVTSMDWPVEPSALTEVLVAIHREYGPDRILVTENGAAFDDAVGADGRVEDPQRIAYLRDHVEAARAALAQGVPLDGYFVWSLLDNFEWAEGYGKRFGIVHVDFETQRRIPKASAEWYRRLRRDEPAG